MASTEGGLQLYSRHDWPDFGGERLFSPTRCTVPAHLQSIMPFFPYESSQGMDAITQLSRLLWFMGVSLVPPELWPCQGGGGSAGGGVPIEFVTPGCIPALTGLSASTCGLSLGGFTPDMSRRFYQTCLQ